MRRMACRLLVVLALPIVRDAVVCVLCFAATDFHAQPPDLTDLFATERSR